MKIAVSAASGALGSNIVKELLLDIPKKDVIGLARTPEKARGLGIEIRRGDYDNKPGLINSLSRIDTLLLVSGMDAPDKRVGQHRNVIDAAVKE